MTILRPKIHVYPLDLAAGDWALIPGSGFAHRWRWSYWDDDGLVACQLVGSPTEEDCLTELENTISAVQDGKYTVGAKRVATTSCWVLLSDGLVAIAGACAPTQALADAKGAMVLEALTWDSVVVDEDGISKAEHFVHNVTRAVESIDEPKVDWFGDDD